MKLLRAIIFICILASGTWAANWICKPASTSTQPWYSFQRLPEKSVDTLFLGSSHVYCGIIPKEVDKSALAAGGQNPKSYSLPGGGQSMSVSYYTLKDALRFQEPKTVALELYGLVIPAKMKYSYWVSNFDYWPWSTAKIGAMHSVMNIKSIIEISTPLARYHSRWDELSASDFRMRSKRTVESSLKGHSKRKTATVVKPIAPTNVKLREDNWQDNLPWMQKIVDLCAENDIQLVIFAVPNSITGQQDWFERVRQSIDFRGQDTKFLDMSEHLATIGIDYETDFYDKSHLNTNGATKASRFFGRYLAEGLIVR